MRSQAWRRLETCCPCGAIGWMRAVMISVTVVPFAVTGVQPVVTLPSGKGSISTQGEWTNDPGIHPSTPHATVFPHRTVSVKPTEAITTNPVTQVHTSHRESSLTSAGDTRPLVTTNPTTGGMSEDNTASRQTVSASSPHAASRTAQPTSTGNQPSSLSATSNLQMSSTVSPMTRSTCNTSSAPVTVLHTASPTPLLSPSSVATSPLPLTSALRTVASTPQQQASTPTPAGSSTPLPAHSHLPASSIVTTSSHGTPSLTSMTTALPSQTTPQAMPPKTTTGISVTIVTTSPPPGNGMATSTVLILRSQHSGTSVLGTSTPRPVIRLTSERSSSPAQDQTYSDEAALIALLTVVCSVTGVVVLLLLAYLIYKQNRKWKRERSAQSRRTLGVVNQTFFNRDNIIEEENGHVEHAEREDLRREQLEGAPVAPGQSFRGPDELDVRNPTSEYSSSVESLSAPLNGQLGPANRETSVASQPRGLSPSAARWRAMTDDSGYEQGLKEDPWESGAPRFDANPNLPITTQHVYTNINSESDLDLTSDATSVRQDKPGREKNLPIPFVELATPLDPDPGDFPKATKHGKFDCQPVVNADGIIVRTARFPSKTSSQLSNSDHDSDRLLAQSSH